MSQQNDLATAGSLQQAIYVVALALVEVAVLIEADFVRVVSGVECDDKPMSVLQGKIAIAALRFELGVSVLRK